MSQDRFEDDDLEFEYEQRKPKRGMTTGTKILLAILIGGGACFVLCCGIGIYMAFNAFEVSNDPADVVATTNEITDIDIPHETFPPQASVKMNFFGIYKMKMAVYTDDQGEDSTFLMIASMEVANLDPDEMESALKQSASDQAEGNDLKIDSSETRDVEIKGQQHEFVFSEATNNRTGKKFRQIKGAFPAKKGSALIIIQIPEDKYDEEAVMEMLNSIQ